MPAKTCKMPAKKLQYLESIILDSTSNGLMWNENEVQSEAMNIDITALLLLANTERWSTIKLNLLGELQTFRVRVVSPETPRSFRGVDFRTLSREAFAKLQKDVPKFFKGAPSKAFGKGLEIQVWPKNRPQHSFQVYPSTGSRNNCYFLNFSCAPNTIMEGNNMVPTILIDTPEKAVDLASLPVKIVAELIDSTIFKTVFKDGRVSSLWNGVMQDDKPLRVNRLQIAMYTPLFKTKIRRNYAHMMLYTKLDCHDYKIGSAGGVSTHDVLNIKVDRDKSTTEYNADGRVTGLSGFLVKQYSGRNHVASIGFYCKDIVERNNAEAEGREFILDPKLDVDRRIRLDITLQYRGLQKLAHKLLNRPEESSVTLKTVEEIFDILLDDENTSLQILQFVLKDQLKLDQLLNVQRADWVDAFEIMKERNYPELVDFYKTWGGNCEIKITNAMKELGVPLANYSRLKKLVFEETGVDISFPYTLWQATNIRVRQMFMENDTIDEMFESTGANLKNVARQKEQAVKRTYAFTKGVYKSLLTEGANHFTVSA